MNPEMKSRLPLRIHMLFRIWLSGFMLCFISPCPLLCWFTSPTCVRAGGNRILSSFLSYWYGSMTLLLIYSVRNSESINYFPVFRLKNPGKEPSEADSRHWSADCLSLPISKVCLISIPPLSRPLSLYSVVSVSARKGINFRFKS